MTLPAGIGRVLTFSSVTGQVTMDVDGSNFEGPDGGSYTSNDITAANGISGILTPTVGYLAGVFLNGAVAGNRTSPPASLDFTAAGLSESFPSLVPLMTQTLFIGDGLTGTGTGAVQQFAIPDSATAGAWH